MVVRPASAFTSAPSPASPVQLLVWTVEECGPLCSLGHDEVELAAAPKKRTHVGSRRRSVAECLDLDSIIDVGRTVVACSQAWTLDDALLIGTTDGELYEVDPDTVGGAFLFCRA